MLPYEMIQKFCEDKLMTSDTKFEVTKLVEAVMNFEKGRCAKIAEEWGREQYGGQPSPSTQGICDKIAAKIRAGIPDGSSAEKK